MGGTFIHQNWSDTRSRAASPPVVRAAFQVVPVSKTGKMRYPWAVGTSDTYTQDFHYVIWLAVTRLPVLLAMIFEECHRAWGCFSKTIWMVLTLNCRSGTVLSWPKRPEEFSDFVSRTCNAHWVPKASLFIRSVVQACCAVKSCFVWYSAELN